MTDKMLGEILRDMELLTPDQLNEATMTHAALNSHLPLANTLVKLGYLSEAKLQQILKANATRLSFAETLLSHGFLTKEDLDIALEMSSNERLPLDKVLMNLEFMSEENLAKAMALYGDRPFSHLDSRASNVKAGLAKSIMSFSPEHHFMVPVSINGTYVTIAMNRPLPAKRLQQLEERTRLKVATVIATESEIRQAQKRFSSLSSSGDSAVRRIEMSDSIMDILASEKETDEVEESEVQQVTEKDSILVKLVNQIIYDAYNVKASDIHIEPYPGKEDIVVRMRIDGACSVIQRLPFKYKYAIVSRIKIMGGMDIAERRKPQDGKIDFKKFGPLDLELRVATMPAVGQMEDVVIRLLQSGEPLSFDKLMLTPRNVAVFESALKKPYGLILVVGPTGSGKTTTLHSGIAKINRPDLKILTAEDPVEITQKGLRQLQVNQKIGLTFAVALRSFLRLDPDVIMVGEMRDLETASIAIEASLTGHLVLSTLHTNSAAETVTRLLDMGLDPFSFSDSLLCILAQRLARRLCDHCKKSWHPSESELQEIISEYGAEAFALAGINREKIVMAKPVGCDYCLQTGYKGRVGIHEVLECGDAMRELIKKRAEVTTIRSFSMSEGMTTLKQDGIMKVLQGITDIHEIRKVCIR